ncbi:hypothetical protein CMUS01_05567 [Colletotrichum musicola]|uniref:Uncharacterized protein n=1 Tax=Colletotrichum musicola TaxID=2175873 RepID=A0A8H6KQT3_9PEZI|nr:hypothetical protein CMUS01_05567 [Colletotrichum musicola]
MRSALLAPSNPSRSKLFYDATVDNSAVSLENTRLNVRTNLELMQLLSGEERGHSPYWQDNTLSTCICLTPGLTQEWPLLASLSDA